MKFACSVDRDDSDEAEPGELAKRLCSMTERNMSARQHKTAARNEVRTGMMQ